MSSSSSSAASPSVPPPLPPSAMGLQVLTAPSPRFIQQDPLSLLPQHGAPGKLYVGGEEALADYELLSRLHIGAIATLYFNPLCTLYLAAIEGGGGTSAAAAAAAAITGKPASSSAPSSSSLCAQDRLCVHEIPDMPDAPLTAALDELVPFALGHLRAGRNVLVHCQAGRSRSVAIAAAVLCVLSRISVTVAMERIIRARPLVHPHRQFLQTVTRWCTNNKRTAPSSTRKGGSSSTRGHKAAGRVLRVIALADDDDVGVHRRRRLRITTARRV